MDKNRASLKKSLEELNCIIKLVDGKIMKLQTVALQPNFKSMEKYLDNVIAKVKNAHVDETPHKGVKILHEVKQSVLSKTKLTDLIKDI